MKKSASLFILLIVGMLVNGQSVIKQVRIGDTIPALRFENIRNYSGKSLNLRDLKKQLIIIDIWSHWCSSCIAAFPKMEALQKKFNNKIQILLVTSDNEKEFEKIYNRSPIVKNTSLPMIVNYKDVEKLFPYVSLPMHIWIDSAGIVAQITSGYNTTEQNISMYLDGKNIDVNRRDNEIMDFDKSVPLLEEGGGRHWKRVQSFSFFMKSLPDYKSSSVLFTQDTGKGTIGIKLINLPLTAMILFGAGVTHVAMEFEGAQNYLIPENDESLMNKFENDFLFCYESMLPKKGTGRRGVRERLLRDICEYFQFDVSIESRMMDCYYVTSKGPLNLQSKEDENDSPISEHILGKWIFKGAVFESFINTIPRMLNDRMDVAVIDRTGYGTRRIDLELNFKDGDISALNRELRKYNLYVEKGTTKQDVAIVKRKKI